MKVTIVVSWETLMSLAKDLDDATKSGDAQMIQNAKAKHDAYVQMCLRADKMILPPSSLYK